MMSSGKRGCSISRELKPNKNLINNECLKRIHLNPMQRRLIMSLNNTLFTPQWPVDAISASVLRERFVATSATLEKFATSF
jgi:hypothetical protein